MKHLLHLLWGIIIISGCSSPSKEAQSNDLEEIPLDYAEGFQIFQGNGFKIIEVSRGFPGDHSPFRYLVKENDEVNFPKDRFDAIIPSNVNKVILTSTTQIPHLDLLGMAHTLVGFPNPDLISSNNVRKEIDKGHVQHLGSGAQYDLEGILDLSPDLIMVSTTGNDLKDLQLLQKSGLAVVINGEYMENQPLGRAEWIKFTGALTGKHEAATKVFDEIAQAYKDLKSKTQKISTAQMPTVLCGSLYKDIWYAPGGQNWGAAFFKDAGANYVFSDQKEKGSLQLNYEFVLDHALDADILLSTTNLLSLEEMAKSDDRYTKLRAFQKGKVYTFANTKGPTGGTEYFELGYTRPDIVLKDLIKIFHPDVLPGYKPYFYQKLH